MSLENHAHQNPHPSAARFFCIDRDSSIAQLEALGYREGDIVYLRAIPGSGYNGGAINIEAIFPALPWSRLENYQGQGKGIYFVVNGGGHADKDITGCRAIFCEFDDRPIEDQIFFWRDKGLPESSLQVATRKSVHTYWVLSNLLPVEQWRKLQADLLAYTGSDPTLKNPSRVMRLSGSWHVKSGFDPIRCDSISINKKLVYDFDDLRSFIPEQKLQSTPLLPTPGIMSPGVSQPVDQSVQYQRYEDIQIPVPDAVPLYQCLSKQSRALIDSGVSCGSRNDNGAKLARDLIGTANHLQSIGQRFDGDPRQMLDDYAKRCTPALDAKEVDAIWKSADKDRPSPSCTPEGVEACIKGWYWNHFVLPNQSASGGSGGRRTRGFGGGNSGNSGSSGNGDASPLAAVSLCDRIREILNRYNQESLQVNALMDLATAWGRTYNEISQLAKIIRAEGDLAEEVIEAVKSFQGTLKSCRKRLDIERYLEPALANPLLAKAAAMPTAPEYLFNTLLPTSASRIGTAARVIINPEGGYKQPCILWTANVSHSGQAKTPPQQEIIHPLEQMEAAAKELHDIRLEDYQQSKDKDAPTPVRQRRLLNNVTTSTKIRIHEENPRGLLEYIDELVADYSRLNQYKSGKGDDLQLELSFWNGAGGNYDRTDVRLFLARTAFSKTGTYQWDTLARLMADDVNFIASGYSARFLYCSILDAPLRYLDLLSVRSPDTLNEKLQWLYGELEKLPEADYLLSHEAKVLFQGWNHALVNADIEEVYYGLSLVYAKIESYTARIALWLHIVNAVLRGEKPQPVISGETMQHAIEIGSFYLWQHKLIHAHNSPTRKLEGIFLKVQTQAEKFFAKTGMGVGASFLKTRINALKSWVVEKIRSTVFKTLASSGHGRIEGDGADMVYIPNTVSGDVPPDGIGVLGGIGDELVEPPIAKTAAGTKVQSTIGEVGDVTTPDLSSRQQDKVLELDSNSEEIHQFTNSSGEPVAQSELQSIGGHQSTHQSPIEDPLGGNLLIDLEMAAWYGRLSACQTLDDAINFYTSLDALSPEQRHQFESSVPEDTWAWFWNLPEVQQKEPESVPKFQEPEPPEPESMPEQTLEQLKALLLACDSLVQLNELKRTHLKTIALAYRSMSELEQAHVDALRALAVPHRVFKYVGDEIKLGTERLIRGMLVYFDPQTQVRATAKECAVWAINGVSSGWKQPVHVSLSLLQEVVKAVLPEIHDGGQLRGLI